MDGVPVFTAQELSSPERPSSDDTLSGTVLLVDEKGAARPGAMVEVLLRGASGIAARAETDETGAWTLPRPDSDVKVRLRLQNKFWSVQNPSTGAPYEWEAASGAFQLDPGSANGQIGYIHLQYVDAMGFLSREGVGADWWGKAVAVRYPGDGDYFTGSQLVLTRAKAWDVNLHEFGHAVMAKGTSSYGGGGYHQISKCYSQGLAWSEGFATFFAGAVRLDTGAEDARFEYLAGGITLENLPASVCKGDTNEWRVAAALWDIYDAHPDGLEAASLPFRRTWDPISGKTLGGFKDAWTFLRPSLEAGELTAVQGALEQNTLPERKDRLRPPDLLRDLARPSWDGPVRL